MVITIDNYEAFALDYIEGNLAPDKKAAFEAFLVEHPTIAEEIGAMTILPVLIADQSIGFQDKKSLLKSSFGSRLIPMWSRQKSLAVAASILFLLGVGIYFMGKKEIGVTLEWNDESFEGNYATDTDTVKTNENTVSANPTNTLPKENIDQEPRVIKSLPTVNSSKKKETVVKVGPVVPKVKTNKPTSYKPKDSVTLPQPPNTNTNDIVEAPKPTPKAVQPPAILETPTPAQQPLAPVAQTVTPQSKPTTPHQQPSPQPKNNNTSPPVAQAPPTEKPKTKFWNKVRDALLPEIVSENDRPVAKIQLPKVKFNFD